MDGDQLRPHGGFGANPELAQRSCIGFMLNPGPSWRVFEADDERRTYPATYEEAVRRFAASWAHVRAVRPDVGDDWMEDVQASIRVARAVNGLPPTG